MRFFIDEMDFLSRKTGTDYTLSHFEILLRAFCLYE